MKKTLTMLFMCSSLLFPQSWDQVIKAVASDRSAGAGYGLSVAVDGDYAVVGAQNESDAGAAYILFWDGTTWTQQQKIVAADRQNGDAFGFAVSISGDYAIVGAKWNNYDASGANMVSDAGAAYIFVRSGSTWTQQQKIVASDRAGGVEFGYAVDIAGEYAIVGAHAASAAYIFLRSGSSWSQQQRIVAGDGDLYDYFGESVSLSGSYAIVGSIYDDEDAGGLNPLTDAGSAYIFFRDGASWSQQQKIVSSNRNADDRFGISVSLSGDYAVVGAMNDDEQAANAGAAYVFIRSGTSWSLQQKMMAADGTSGDSFGYSVSLSGDYVIAGAHNDYPSGISYAGSAYVFSRNTTTWTQQQKLNASDLGAGDQYARSVSISGGHIIIGAWKEDENASGTGTLTDAGSAYLYKNPALLPAVIPQQSVSLDGTDDFVTMGLHDDHKLTSTLTVEAWIKPSRNNGYDGIANNIFWTGVQTSGFGLFMGGFNAVNMVEFIVMNSNTSGYQELFATLPSLNAWHHIAGTYDGAMMRLYVDGVQAESLAVSGAVAHAYTTAWKVGAYIDDNEWRYYQGYIDDVRLWNVARTSAQIANNRYAELNGNESGLVGYWKFNEGSGTTADDASSFSHDGTLTNGAGWPGETGLPVELTSFAASANGSFVALRWTTATESNNHGFEIQRSAISLQHSEADNRPLTAESNSWTMVGFVDGNGTSSTPHEYRFNDRIVNAGTYVYRLRQIDRDGSFRFSEPVEVTVVIQPSAFGLQQNYPNPFNPVTVIRYQLITAGHASLKIYDAVGRQVAVLVDEALEPGVYSATFDGSRFSAGVYISVLTSNGHVQQRRMVLVK